MDRASGLQKEGAATRSSQLSHMSAPIGRRTNKYERILIRVLYTPLKHCSERHTLSPSGGDLGRCEGSTRGVDGWRGRRRCELALGD
jgi:hypothetical protein